MILENTWNDPSPRKHLPPYKIEIKRIDGKIVPVKVFFPTKCGADGDQFNKRYIRSVKSFRHKLNE